MSHPRVTFIVPCYNLAHLLPECVHSILEQSFRDFEILIMDDCSPDTTAEVAASFTDPRVRHVRNATNLGHLANYNRGIRLARGTYIWLISADDRLRRPYVLERYVRLMDSHPEVGFVFCPAMAFNETGETEIERWSYHGERELFFRGKVFLRGLLHSNCVSAACGMARAVCYEVEQFPLDLPYAGDWYLWCLFALHRDVAYLPEPMVNYRRHDLSLTTFFLQEGVKKSVTDEILVRWRILRRAEAAGFAAIARHCRDAIVEDYLNRIGMKRETGHPQGLSVEECEESIAGNARDLAEKRGILARLYLGLSEQAYRREGFPRALAYFRKSLQEKPLGLFAWVKFLLLMVGGANNPLLKSVSFCLHVVRKLRWTA